MHFIILVISLALSVPAFAGSRNGYRLVFFDNFPIKSEATTKVFDDYFNAELPSNIYECENKNRFIDFEIVYIHQLPKTVTRKLIQDGVNSDSNKKALEKLRTTLRNFRNSEIDRGFDGLLTYSYDGNSYALTAISSIPNGYKKTAKVTNDGKGLTPEKLKTLFCETTAELDYAYQSN